MAKNASPEANARDTEMMTMRETYTKDGVKAAIANPVTVQVKPIQH